GRTKMSTSSEFDDAVANNNSNTTTTTEREAEKRTSRRHAVALSGSRIETPSMRLIPASCRPETSGWTRFRHSCRDPCVHDSTRA
ncbi:hypothetical protein E4U53_006493, partial [Claviceps sorghi]